MGIIWISHEYHLDITWVSSGYHIGIIWISHGYHLDITSGYEKCIGQDVDKISKPILHQGKSTQNEGLEMIDMMCDFEVRG